jgi:hypothetical protein
MHHFRCISPKQVLTPQKKTSCHFFKIAIFSKFFHDAMSHIIRWNADKKIKSNFELFIKQKIEFQFVLFSIVQTLFCLIGMEKCLYTEITKFSPLICIGASHRSVEKFFPRGEPHLWAVCWWILESNDPLVDEF